MKRMSEPDSSKYVPHAPAHGPSRPRTTALQPIRDRIEKVDTLDETQRNSATHIASFEGHAAQYPGPGPENIMTVGRLASDD